MTGGDGRDAGAPTAGEGTAARAGSYRHFENVECEYYPCHAIARVNCLFCFCPLYRVEDCGGDWSLTAAGAKDCAKCVRPHVDGGYEFVMSRLS